MKDFFKLKSWIITLTIIILAVFISAGIVLFEVKNFKIALAGAGDNVSGYAWNSDYGWISFNCINDSSCATVDYGVAIDSATGYFSGYAWSSNLGWIDFAPSNGYPEAPLTDVHYNSATGDITGWAKILSLGDDGWIKMSGSWGGVVIDGASGDFSGYGWNESAGWLSFNCLNDSSCGSSNYKVSASGLTPSAPTGLTAMAENCTTMRLDWTDNSTNEIGFETQWSEDEILWTSHSPDLNPNIVSRTITQSPMTTLYYRVRALGTGGNSSWEPISGGARGDTNYCAPTLSQGSANCEVVNLNWTQNGGGIDHYETWRNKDGAGWNMIEANIPSTQLNYADGDIVSGSSYQYYIKAQNLGLDSNIISVDNPCPNLPGWKEIKAN